MLTQFTIPTALKTAGQFESISQSFRKHTHRRFYFIIALVGKNLKGKINNKIDCQSNVGEHICDNGKKASERASNQRNKQTRKL